jgi:DnaD/phage-associated family protein
MAKYRQIYTEFWSDTFVLELTPEEKYFYLYLISNSKSTQSGIYEISSRTIETDTGYNRETVEKLIQRFCDYKKILYCEETKELMVINWIKYNVPNNQNTIKCIQKEILKVKNKVFVKVLFNKCLEIGLDADKIFDNYKFDYNSVNNLKNVENNKNTEKETNKLQMKKFKGAWKGVPSNIEEVISKKQEVISKIEVEEVINKNNSAADAEGIKNIIKTFEENVHAITPRESEIILEFTKHVTSEVINMAIDEAVIYNVKSIKYISNILNNWIKNGIKTAGDVRSYQKKWTYSKKNVQSPNIKKGSFCDFEQRTYDFDDLEKRLLGQVDTEVLE